MNDEIDELIKKLREYYPDKMVREQVEANEYWKLVGKLDLIDQIEFMFEREQF